MWLRDLKDFAVAHHGLISLDVALAAGVPRRTWYSGIERGAVERVSSRVVRLWGAPETFEQRALAAVWSAGVGAVASHRTAARLWGVSRPEDEPIDVLVVGESRHLSIPGAIVHRPKDSKNTSPVVLRGIPTTRVTRTLVDLGAVDRWGVLDAMATLLAANAVTVTQIDDALGRHSRQGRSGVVALRTALEAWSSYDGPPDSALEARMAGVLRRHGLPSATFHARVAGYEVDFLVDGTRVVIECDGWRSHGLDRDQFEFDRRRDADIVAAGYVVVHVTWRALTRNPALVVRQLRAVLRR